tara:strand:- start:56 stop:433 length:378 start_codon:yes stop_codon:yes gene_type:complete
MKRRKASIRSDWGRLSDIVKRFSKLLVGPTYPRTRVPWDVKGRLKKSNKVFKFEVKDMFNMNDGFQGRHGILFEKVDKKVFETDKQWVIVDADELHRYLIKNKILKVHLNDLIAGLEWTIFIPKK